MAFNPFHSFRKYQKYWMASAVLVCMVTFVLCGTGMGSRGLDDYLLSMFRRRGEDYATVNGRRYTYEDLTKLKENRLIANDFMRELLKVAIKSLERDVTQAKIEIADDAEEFKKAVTSVKEICLTDLVEKLNRDPRYFRGGTKLDDLVDFICWRDLADKWGVILDDDQIKNLVLQACHWRFSNFTNDVSAGLEIQIQNQHAMASKASIMQALRDEFRVQVVQLAAIARWSPGVRMPDGAEQRDFLADKAAIPDGNNRIPVNIYLNTPMQLRIVPTPEEISAYYKTVRTELTIDMLPISLEEVAKKIKLPDDPAKRLAELKEFYDKNTKNPYNPTLDTPGFLFPARAEIQFLTADATMDYYKIPAHIMSVLQKTPVLAFTSAVAPLAGAIGWLEAGLAWDASLDRNLEKDRQGYEKRLLDMYQTRAYIFENYLSEKDTKKKEETKTMLDRIVLPPYPHDASSWITPNFYSAGQLSEALAKPSDATVASLVAGLSAGPFIGVADYQGVAYQVQATKIKPMVPLEVGKRARVGAELFLAQTPQICGLGAFTAAGLTYYAETKPQFLPIAGYLETQLATTIEEIMAQRWVNSAMLDAKKQLEAVQRNPEVFPERVKELKKKGFESLGKDGKKRYVRAYEFGETSQLRNEYEIEFDDALKPLHDSFDKNLVIINTIEGRQGKPEMLHRGDFAKLFFGTEGLGVGSQEPYTPRAWPPTVKLPKERQSLMLAAKSLEHRLFDVAEKPVIFWKSVKRGPEPLAWNPKDQKTMDFIESQYRLAKARTMLLEEVKKIAEEIKSVQRTQGEKDVPGAMRELAKKYGAEVITLNKVAKLVENTDRRPTDPLTYGEYELPRRKIPFAREDMVKDLLALHNLPAPLKKDIDELDDINKALYWRKNFAGIKTGQGKEQQDVHIPQVQVLTNKPRSVYYIATVASYVEPSAFTFYNETLPTALGSPGTQSTFVDQVQEEYGRRLVTQMVKYLRAQGDATISDTARKSFAEESASQ